MFITISGEKHQHLQLGEIPAAPAAEVCPIRCRPVASAWAAWCISCYPVIAQARRWKSIWMAGKNGGVGTIDMMIYRIYDDIWWYMMIYMMIHGDGDPFVIRATNSMCHHYHLVLSQRLEIPHLVQGVAPRLLTPSRHWGSAHVAPHPADMIWEYCIHR